MRGACSRFVVCQFAVFIVLPRVFNRPVSDWHTPLNSRIWVSGKRAHSHTHYTHAPKRTYKHTRDITHTYTHSYKAYTHTYIYTRIHGYTHSQKYTCTQTQTHTHTRARARAHTHTHTHTYRDYACTQRTKPLERKELIGRVSGRLPLSLMYSPPVGQVYSVPADRVRDLTVVRENWTQV